MTIPVAQLPESHRAALLAAGMVHQGILHIDRAVHDRIVKATQPRATPAPTEAIQRMIGVRELICGSCDWNVDWICEHSGCKPCRQRAAGGLKQALRNPRFQCPAKLHPPA